ncbi:MAG: energy-coupled thiamine transporter ThiT [Clostridia bacterium]|nr:energy-coupled thiamine transporter ThiT [Clostridia bacterium]
MTAKKKFNLHIMTESAIMIALATVLSFIKVYEAPFGGSVTLLSMAPIIILALRNGAGVGLAAGFVHSVLQLMFGLANVAWVPDVLGKVLCVFLDYILPFTCLGLAGLFRGFAPAGSSKKRMIAVSLIAVLAVTLLRFGFHILSGGVIWHALDLEWYADDPSHIVNQYSKWIFSLVYNGWFMIPEIIETAVGVPVLYAALAKVKNRNYNYTIE